MRFLLLHTPDPARHARPRCQCLVVAVIGFALLATISSGGCATLKKMTGRGEPPSPYAVAPPFDPNSVAVTDPASLPPIIRGAAADPNAPPVVPAPGLTIPAPSVLPITQSRSGGSTDPYAAIAARVVELESQLAQRDAILASREQEIAGLQRSVLAPSPTPLDATPATVQTVSKVVSEEERAPRLALPVVVAPDVRVVQSGETIRITIPDATLFRSGSYELAPTGEEVLRQVVSEVRMIYPDAILEIEGHSDNVVTNPQNPTQLQEVTSYKANIVMRYMVSSLGLSAEKIRPSGFGATSSVADNATDEGRRANRRFVLVVRPVFDP